MSISDKEQPVPLIVFTVIKDTWYDFVSKLPVLLWYILVFVIPSIGKDIVAVHRC